MHGHFDMQSDINIHISISADPTAHKSVTRYAMKMSVRAPRFVVRTRMCSTRYTTALEIIKMSNSKRHVLYFSCSSFLGRITFG